MVAMVIDQYQLEGGGHFTVGCDYLFFFSRQSG